MEFIVNNLKFEEAQKACEEINNSQLGVRLKAQFYEVICSNPRTFVGIAEEQTPCEHLKEIIEATKIDRKKGLWVMVYVNGQLTYNLPAEFMVKERTANSRWSEMRYGCSDLEPKFSSTRNN